MKQRIRPRIALIGFYGRGNFGDDLMCQSLGDFLLRSSEASIRVLTSDVEAHAALRGCRVEIVPRSLFQVARVFVDCDVLCQGGGTIFHDSYSGSKLLSYWGKLLVWTILIHMGRLAGLKVLMLGAGIGPLRYRTSRWITRLALSACNIVGVRDSASEESVKECGVADKCKMGFDLAALPQSVICDPRRELHQSSVSLGISACSLTGFLGSSELNDRFWASLAEAIGVYHERQPVRVELLSLFTGTSSEQDDTVNDLIESLLPPGIPVLRRRYSRNVQEFAQEFLGCEWYVCTKYHAALAAYLAGSNFAVVTYNRKVSDLADEIAMPASRRVAADGVQPVSAWLDLFQSLGSFDVAPQLLDRRRAAARARQAVCGSLESIGMQVSSRRYEVAI